MVSILCMVQRISHEYKPIYLGNHHHIYIQVQYPIEFVHNTIVDYHLVNLLDICMLLHDFVRNKWHSVHMVNLVHMDLYNDDSNRRDHQDIQNLNYIQFVRIFQMDFPYNQISIGMPFDDLIQSIQHSQHMDLLIHMD